MSDDIKQLRVTTARYDIRSHSVWRALKQDVLSRVIPFGNFGGGPNLFYIAKLILVHTFGALAINCYLRSGFVRKLVNNIANKMK